MCESAARERLLCLGWGVKETVLADRLVSMESKWFSTSSFINLWKYGDFGNLDISYMLWTLAFDFFFW